MTNLTICSFDYQDDARPNKRKIQCMYSVHEFRKNGRHFLEIVIMFGEKAVNITSGIGRIEENV